MRSWWNTLPSAFRVARNPDGTPAAFQCLCEATSVPAWLIAADPVAATWREHLRANPVPRGQQVLFQRYTLEFDVLQYLCEHEGRVVGRAALLRDVRGYDWSGVSNVVEVVISALRRKLGDRAGSLQTVRGAGYRFTPRPEPR